MPSYHFSCTIYRPHPPPKKLIETGNTYFYGSRKTHPNRLVTNHKPCVKCSRAIPSRHRHYWHYRECNFDVYDEDDATSKQTVTT